VRLKLTGQAVGIPVPEEFSTGGLTGKTAKKLGKVECYQACKASKAPVTPPRPLTSRL